MNWITVSSSRLNAVAWENGKMYIRFVDGAKYVYDAVSEYEYLAFMNASSLGHELYSFEKTHPYKPI